MNRFPYKMLFNYVWVRVCVLMHFNYAIKCKCNCYKLSYGRNYISRLVGVIYLSSIGIVAKFLT